MLQTASVIGKQFDEPLLAEVSGLGAHDLGAVLDGLQAAEFVRLVTPLPRPEYAFKHPLLREAAYQAQLNEHRSRLHRTVATALERLHAERLGEQAGLIAHHWEMGGMRFEAARWKQRAALRVANIKVGRRGRQPMPG